MNEVYMKKDGEFKPLMLAVGDGEQYSTTEQRIGTWIDGKPLYRKVVTQYVNWSASSSLVYNNIPHGISNLGTLVNCSCIGQNSSGKYIIPNFNYSGSAQTWIDYVNEQNIIVNNKASWNGYTLIFILEYTKTTD